MSQRVWRSAMLIGCLALAGCAANDGAVRKPSFAYDRYITRPGDTVESVAWRYKLAPDELRARNRLTGGSILPPGMQLVIAAPATTQQAPAVMPRAETVAMVSTARREPALVHREPLPSVEIPASVRKTPQEEVIETVEFVEPAKVVKPSTAEQQRRTANGWMWPAGGQIARGFQPNVVNRQGLDITLGTGEDIVAAADGTVVYSGQDLASHGKLVILRHDNNVLSAYSMADELYVKEDEKVRAGDAIASLKGDKGSSMFHFEIRKNGNPVDPVTYLPKR